MGSQINEMRASIAATFPKDMRQATTGESAVEKFARGGRSSWGRCVAILFALVGQLQTWAAMPEEETLPAALQNYDPSKLIRFNTLDQAEKKREQLIRWIWSGGLPVDVQPTVDRDIDPAVFEKHLSGLDAQLASGVDRLNASVSPYDYHQLMYFISPKVRTTNSRRLVILNSGHRANGAFQYGVDQTANRLLRDGFHVLMTDMPLVGFNSDNSVILPGANEEILFDARGTSGHNQMFAKLCPPVLPDGEVFRFFLEPFIQGVNYFRKTVSDAGDVSFVGLSGGGWAGHMIAAVDVRIQTSFPVAGSLPLYLRPYSPGSRGDAEQMYEPLFKEVDADGDGIPETAAGVASWLEIYALGGLGPGRKQVQVLNFYDSCCFSTNVYLTYTAFLSELVRDLGEGEWTIHSDRSHRAHMISTQVLSEVIIPQLTGQK